MANRPQHHIIVLPRHDYWQWVDAVRDYAVHFEISVTPSPQNALDFHHPDQVITVANTPAGFPQCGDIVAWLMQRLPKSQIDVVDCITPGDLQSVFAARIASGDALSAPGEGGQPISATSPSFTLLWPTDYPFIVQGFGLHPEVYRRWGLPGHDGIDLKAPVNSQVYACADGEVHKVHDGSRNHPYGIHVRITHHDGYQTIYAHLNRVSVSTGQNVKAGDIIGLADSTGNSSGGIMHLTLKKVGATGAGLTNFPFDIIDPTPYLVPATGRTRLEPGLQWPHDHCLVGLNGRSDGVMAAADWDVVEVARIEALRVPGSTAPSTIDRALAINSKMFVVVNLRADFQGRVVQSSEFARSVEHDAIVLYERGVKYFELHTEPNLVSEGFGSSWHNGFEFGQWFLQVVGQLRPMLPEAKFGWPGLSFGPKIEGSRADAQAFLEQAAEVIRQADWLGCHCFWQDEDGMFALDGGLGYKHYRDEWPEKLLLITEFSNTSADVESQSKGHQYARYYQLLRDQPGIGAAFAFAVSAPTGYAHEVWRSEDGKLAPIAYEVSRRAS
jgi:Peptidase family M23